MSSCHYSNISGYMVIWITQAWWEVPRILDYSSKLSPERKRNDPDNELEAEPVSHLIVSVSKELKRKSYGFEFLRHRATNQAMTRARIIHWDIHHYLSNVLWIWHPYTSVPTLLSFYAFRTCMVWRLFGKDNLLPSGDSHSLGHIDLENGSGKIEQLN